jgi:outer membrane lipoprotein-sorting protein
MKHKTVFLLIAVVFAAALLTPLSSASANGNLDQVLANMQRAARDIKSLNAKMSQEKRNRQIGGKETYSGDIFFKHKGPGNDRVFIRYSNGQKVAVIGDTIMLYQPNIKQAIVTSKRSQGSKNQEFAFFADPYSLSGSQIKARYTVVYVGDEQVGGASTAVLELTPKAASSVRKMKWWVDKSSWLPIKSEVVEKNGDVSTFVLSEVKKNAVIADRLFELDKQWPKDTKVIKQ